MGFYGDLLVPDFIDVILFFILIYLLFPPFQDLPGLWVQVFIYLLKEILKDLKSIFFILPVLVFQKVDGNLQALDTLRYLCLFSSPLL